MLPENENLRIKRTHILLRDTLIDLIVEKGFDAITVKDIAERAMVNRATFYRHFEDKYALVTHIFKEAVADMLIEVGPPEKNIDIFVNFNEASSETSDAKMRAAIAIMTRFFKYFAKNEKLYRSLLGKNGSSWFSTQMRDYLSKMWLQRIHSMKLPLQKKTDARYSMSPEMATVCLAQSVIGMITYWLESGMSETPEEMATGCLLFIAYGYYRALGF
jgi:AcrR family transcriptional regulator